MRVLSLLVLGWSSMGWAQPAGAWRLDVAKSELVVKVWKTGAAAALAHDHVVRATKFSGEVSLDEAGAPESLALAVSVEVASLVPDEPETRKKYFIVGPPVPPADQLKVKEHLLGDEQLDAAKFKAISFKSDGVYREAGGGLQCRGQLTLHGVTREVRFPLTVKAGVGVVEGDASVRLKTSDFGVAPFSTALGLIRNKDEVELVLHLVAVRP